MSDDNNQKSRGPRKGGGTGGRGGGRDGGGFGGKGSGGKGPRSGGTGGGERKPFRGRSEGAERPARGFGKPEGGRAPFRERAGGERPGREGGAERPFRARSEGERSASRPPREGFAPRGERAGGKRFDRPRPERAERPRRPREEAAASEAKLLPSLIQEPERIAKVMARAGVASRRDCEAMIAEGRVSVNGTVLESPALDVGPDDVVLVDGELLPARERTRMWLYHKPRGLVTTNHDPEGRPTVFDALPEDLPRVLSIGRLDINTEGLLLLTNDGGLARMLELPETGWLRRYRVRAFGSVTQDKLDTLRDGVTIDGVHYGPVVARFERQQGSNTWLTVDLREGKNREVKTVLEHLGLDVNRLIRVSFGPFQLGDLPEGEVDELRSRVLKDQLGEELMAKAGVDFEAPRRDEMPAAPPRPPSGDDRPRRRETGDRDDRPERERWESDVVRTPSRDDRSDKPWKRTVWRDEEAEPQRARKAPPRRGADPRIERQAREATGEVVRRRDKAIEDPNGRRVLVERVSVSVREEPREARAPREGATPKRRPDRLPRSERGAAEGRPARARDGGSERPMRRPRVDSGERDRTQKRPWEEAAERPERAPRGDRPARVPREGGERPPRRFSERSGEERGGERRHGGRSFGDKPGGAGRGFGGKSFGGKPFGGKPGGGGRSGGGRPGGKGPRPGGKRG
ncbi:MAG TPA: pseudouridine synthase [Bosea sp. (in: a-proteobacteria)]|jgi:23S rRNA pseudouridine2605 synthase|uniref:pseudouridine synthase n=1 Tax=Bosea sp. (in: a-proteobacteria) TaxID=1871050 RepID=UPI002E124F76|nr:pseudouridine synthase [Bosea sp. (in: a-proteobacteria)]